MRSALSWLILSILFSCKTMPVPESESSSIVDKSTLWKDPGKISVCFVDLKSSSQFADRVKSHINKTYGKTKAVRFQGWGDCGGKIDGSRIAVKLGKGAYLGGGGCSQIGPGVGQCQSNTFTMYIDTNQPNLEGLAAHEFGHAVGLRHEHERADRGGHCAKTEFQPVAKGVNIQYIGNYDDNSIMAFSYCRFDLKDLSAGDIAVLDAVYAGGGGGKTPSGTGDTGGKTGEGTQTPTTQGPSTPSNPTTKTPSSNPPSQPGSRPGIYQCSFNGAGVTCK